MQEFNPPLRTLMGPGPSDVPERVLKALARPTIGHLDPVFQDLMEDIKARLRRVMRTQNAVTFPISAPATAALEASFVNLIEPGDKAVILQNGVFGGRMAETVRRIHGDVALHETQWGRAPDPDDVRVFLKQHSDAKVLAFVHAETSTGARADADALCALGREFGLLVIVDCVTSLGGIPVDVDQWGADVVYSGTQKCLSAPPGLAPITFSQRAVDTVRARARPATSWFLDLSQQLSYWAGDGPRAYHHTAPVNALYGLHEALCMLEEEGLEAAHVRHRRMHERFAQGLADIGLELLVPENERLPQLNAVTVPEGVDEAAVRARLLEHYGLEIGAGLGALKGKVWRVGLMGASVCEDNVRLCLGALEEALGA